MYVYIYIYMYIYIYIYIYIHMPSAGTDGVNSSRQLFGSDGISSI